MSEFIDDIVHIAGDSKVVAGCLSRAEEGKSRVQQLKIVSSVTCDPFDLQAIAEAQTQEFKEEMCQMYSQDTKNVTIPPDMNLLCDNTLIPAQLIHQSCGENCSSTFTTCHIRTGRQLINRVQHVSPGRIWLRP